MPKGVVFCLLAAGALGGCAPARSAAGPAGAVAAVSVVPRPRILVQQPGVFVWPARSGPEVSAGAALRARYGPEAYTLDVDAAGIRIRSASEAGAFYAKQTLAQLTSVSGAERTTPYVHVVDWPAYRWRGIHLDVSRHFFSVATIERVIDTEAQYKLNVFGWHLTDDQAWRLQSRAYPRLAGTPGYSPREVAGVVAYARARHVTVVPEIEIPGHTGAALRVYPGVASSVPFWQRIVDETARLFPSRYLHIGGDEVDYTPERRAFLRAIARAVTDRGRVPVAWDDALAADLPQPAAYVVWRAYGGLQPALRSGHDLVLSPDGPLYFDAYQGDRRQEPAASRYMSTLEEVYDYAPPSGPHILGVQANLWTEKISTPDHLWYMLYPRGLALAELAWDPPARKSWPDFMHRLPAQLQRLEAQGVTFRIPAVAVAVQGARFFAVRGNANAAIARTRIRNPRVTLTDALAGARIYYTTDGSVPTARSTRYAAPFPVKLGAQGVTVRAFAQGGDGRRGIVSECRIALPPAWGSAAGSAAWSSLISP